MDQMLPSMDVRPVDDDPRIRGLETELQRISSILDEMMSANGRRGGAMTPPSPSFQRPAAFSRTNMFAPDDRTSRRERAKLVRHEIRRRRKRESYWPTDLFADPAWDMLLDLYAAACEGQEVSVSSLCIAAAVPSTTALRWIKSLVTDGIFLRREDVNDGRRIFVCLSDAAFAQMERYFDELEE
jgi:hypothetical protein